MVRPSATVAQVRAVPGVSRRLVHLVFVALVDALPLIGIVYFDWSVARCLALFWCETLVQGLLMLARLLVHRRLTHDREYWDANPADLNMTINGKQVTTRSYVAQFSALTFIFTFAHGIFLAGLLVIFSDTVDQHADWGEDASKFSFAKGLGLMVFFQLTDFVHDLVGIRRWPFELIKRIAGRLQGRVITLHLGIIFGFFVIAFMDVKSLVPVLVVVIVIKTLIDLAVESRS
jgi:hypothetical protein